MTREAANTVYRYFVMSDMIWRVSFGLLGPIFAIFVVNSIQGGDALVVGIASMIGLATKSLVQLPVGWVSDKLKGDKDVFWIMFIGLFGSSLVPILYLYIHTPGELYFVQFLYYLLLGCSFPTYISLLSSHIEKKNANLSWATYMTLTDLCSAGAAALGGWLATSDGFPLLILATTVIGLASALALLPARRFMRAN